MRTMIPVVGLALTLAVAGCSAEEAGSGEVAARDASGSVSSEGAVDATALMVGDCVNDPEGADTEEGAEFDSIEAVPCDQPHDNEIYHRFELPEGGEYPGDDPILESTAATCESQFEGFVGLSYEESALDLVPITPTEGAWAEGDREVLCAIYDPAGTKITGTLADAAR